MTSARMPNRAFCSTRKLSNCLLSYPIISGYFGCFLGISFDILFFTLHDMKLIKKHTHTYQNLAILGRVKQEPNPTFRF